MKILLKNSLVTGIIFLCLMSLVPFSFSQTAYVSPGGSVNNTGNVYIQGGLTNEGQVENKRFILLTGNLTNNTGGVYADSGIHVFAGTSNQTINGFFTGTSFLDTIWRQQPVGIAIVVRDSVNAQVLYMGSTDGRLDLNIWGSVFWIQSNQTNAVLNAGSNRYVDVGNNSGYFLRNVNDITGTYLFPIGNSTCYRGTHMRLQTLGTSGSQYVLSTIMNGTSGTINYVSTKSCGVIGFDCLADNPVHLYSPATSYNYKLWLESENCDTTLTSDTRTVISPATLNNFDGVIETSIVGSVDASMCDTDPFKGPYTLLDIDVTLASKTQSLLPIELITLKATPIDNEFIRVEWATTSEKNCAGFEVQRSIDGIVWENIGWIDGHGNSSSVQNYSLDDHNITPNVTYYYRLKQVDTDGKFNFSWQVSAKIVGTGVWDNIYPNPSSVNPILQIMLPEAQTITLSCYNALGQEQWQKKIDGTVGDQNKIELENSAPGMYIIKIQIGNQIFSRKYIRQ